MPFSKIQMRLVDVVCIVFACLCILLMQIIAQITTEAYCTKCLFVYATHSE